MLTAHNIDKGTTEIKLNFNYKDLTFIRPHYVFSVTNANALSRDVFLPNLCTVFVSLQLTRKCIFITSALTY
jgi:ribosomal protein L28